MEQPALNVGQGLGNCIWNVCNRWNDLESYAFTKADCLIPRVISY